MVSPTVCHSFQLLCVFSPLYLPNTGACTDKNIADITAIIVLLICLIASGCVFDALLPTCKNAGDIPSQLNFQGRAAQGKAKSRPYQEQGKSSHPSKLQPLVLQDHGELLEKADVVQLSRCLPSWAKRWTEPLLLSQMVCRLQSCGALASSSHWSPVVRLLES